MSDNPPIALDYPTLSIVVPSFNQAAFLDATLQSLLSQGYPCLQIIVIDGNSTDGSVEIIRRYAEHLDYWVSEPDDGQSHALNKGFDQATGEWLSWLNSDDLLLPGALQALAEAIAANPTAAWFTGGGWFINTRGKRKSHYKPPVTPRTARDLASWTSAWFSQPGTFFTRQLFDTAGGRVREDLRYAMDLDLWFRMGAHSPLHPVAHDMGAYRIHDTSKTHAEWPGMDREVAAVIYEHLGFEAVLERIEFQANVQANCQAQLDRIHGYLRTPGGLLKLIFKGVRVFWRSVFRP